MHPLLSLVLILCYSCNGFNDLSSISNEGAYLCQLQCYLTSGDPQFHAEGTLTTSIPGNDMYKGDIDQESLFYVYQPLQVYCRG